MASARKSGVRTASLNSEPQEAFSNWEILLRLVGESWFREMGSYAKPDAQLCEVGYLLDGNNAER
jgi:hypothetical protein